MASRMNISVPPDLKRRMDKVKEPVNWSGVACLAFEAKLGELAERKEIKKMTDVIERLRASKRRAESQQEEDGYKDGRNWAEKHAQADHLERLKRFVDRYSVEVGMLENSISGTGTAYSPGEHAYFVIEPSADGDRAGAFDFWEMIVGDAPESAMQDVAYVEGFMVGAVALWEEVAKKL